MSYLFEHKTRIDADTGQPEMAWSPDAEGYPEEEWTIVSEGAAAKPRENCNWDSNTKRWKKCPIKTATAEREAKYSVLTRAELMDIIEEKFAEIEARLAVIEGQGK